MAYSPSIWPKVAVGLPAVAITVFFVGQCTYAYSLSAKAWANTQIVGAAMRSCASEHDVRLDWQQHPEMFAFDAEVRHFSAVTSSEVAAANCIVEALPEMSRRSPHPIVCIDENAQVELERTITGRNQYPAEENYRFVLSPCGAVERDNP